MSALIYINNNYCIKLEHYSWSVCKWKDRKNHQKNGTWEAVSWHRTLQKAGEWLVLHMVSKDDLDDIDSIIYALSQSSLLISTSIIDSGISNSWLDTSNNG